RSSRSTVAISRPSSTTSAMCLWSSRKNTLISPTVTAAGWTVGNLTARSATDASARAVIALRDCHSTSHGNLTSWHGEVESPSTASSTRRWLDPPRADVVAAVPALGEAVDADDGARVRRVDELVAADVDAHMVEVVEEDEVARLELIARHG